VPPLIDQLRTALQGPDGDPALRCLALFHGTAAAGRFDAVEALVGLSTEIGVDPARLEAAALQVVAYGGFPRAIEALERLAAARDGAPPAGEPDPRQPDDYAEQGLATFRRVYTSHADAVLQRLDGLSPGFSRHVLESAYGRVLAGPGLELGERELLAVSALALCALAVPLSSHIRGALLNGFPSAAIEDILLTSAVLADDRALPVIHHALDRLSRKVFRT
jgi:4-carboxymuconolactone decarboxylase